MFHILCCPLTPSHYPEPPYATHTVYVWMFHILCCPLTPSHYPEPPYATHISTLHTILATKLTVHPQPHLNMPPPIPPRHQTSSTTCHMPNQPDQLATHSLDLQFIHHFFLLLLMMVMMTMLTMTIIIIIIIIIVIIIIIILILIIMIIIIISVLKVRSLHSRAGLLC